MQRVALDAGVSIATASRVLNQQGGVSEELVARVEESAAALGYRMNRAARTLRRQRAEAIGLVVSDVENPFFASVARAVETVAHESGFAVLLCNTDEDLDKEDLYFELMVEEHVAGVIVAPSIEDPSRLDPFAAADIPVVCVDREVGGDGFDTVMVDNPRGAAEAIRHLAAHGHTRIGLVAGAIAGTPSRQRVEGCQRAVAELDGVSLHVRTGGLRAAIGVESTMELGGELAASLLAMDDPPTAIFCANNLLTQGVLLSLRARGLRIPQDVALVGWDDTPLYQVIDPPLTVVAQPTSEIGRTAAKLLFERINGSDVASGHRLVEPQLVIRSSCGTHGADDTGRRANVAAPVAVDSDARL